MPVAIVKQTGSNLKVAGSGLKKAGIHTLLPSPDWFCFAGLLATLFFFQSCTLPKTAPPRFTKLTPDSTGIHFINRVHDTETFNILNYLYFYDGGGVAAGDIDNDGWIDLYFTANDTPDRLYRNKGNFKFEDITQNAGILTDDNGWTTGVSMADVNGDGYLDIYVCRVNYLDKTGPNQLFINNGDGTFTERAAHYGLDFKGYSTQAAFFDYDSDGDLDLFLLNHTMHGENSYGDARKLRRKNHPKAGDKLFRNDDGTFVDVTSRAGIFSSHLGYGLGLAISDINLDGRPDIYVGNDFHEDDYLYINQGDGTFTEQLAPAVTHTSRSSMGNDIADINNDGLPDILSLDMLPGKLSALKVSGGADMAIVSKTKARYGFKPQFAHNTLQLHRGFTHGRQPVLSEIAFSAGIAATDWSWAGLIADLDNDGWNDIWITNGIYRRPNDLDFITSYQNFQENSLSGPISANELTLIEKMPATKVPNAAFRNRGNLTFEESTARWGLHHTGFSSGSVYADLNKDGALDLVVNNTNQPASIYKNRPPDSTENYLKISLRGPEKNVFGLGTKVYLYSEDKQWYREQYPVRGFQSTVSHQLHVGVGHSTSIDSIRVIWPGQRTRLLTGIPVNQTLELLYNKSSNDLYTNHLTSYNSPIFKLQDTISVTTKNGSGLNYSSFQRNPLLPYSKSTLGPALAVGDVNGDGRDDMYLGGLAGYAGTLYVQNKQGGLVRTSQPVFRLHEESVDTDAIFVDVNGDDAPDLYVVSGGGLYPLSHPGLQDRLYLNDGNGNFTYAQNNLPPMSTNGSVVAATDIDGDGDTDIFVGGYGNPDYYGRIPTSYLLQNDDRGYFVRVTEQKAVGLSRAGMISSAAWADLDDDQNPELILAGEWMPITIFGLSRGRYINQTKKYGLQATKGLWQHILVDDIDENGTMEIIGGNIGTNSRLQASRAAPLRLYRIKNPKTANVTSVLAQKSGTHWYPMEPMDELALAWPQLKQQVPTYKAYSSASMSDLFTPQQLAEAEIREVTTLHSAIFRLNDKNKFTGIYLPPVVQTYPVFAIHTAHYSGNSKKDVILGGNLISVKPSYGGSMVAGLGTLLTWTSGSTLQPVQPARSGLFIRGEIRGIQTLNDPEQKKRLIIVRHGQPLQIYTEQ